MFKHIKKLKKFKIYEHFLKFGEKVRKWCRSRKLFKSKIMKKKEI